MRATVNRIDGGAGVDTLSYATASGGIAISLATVGAQSTGGSGSDKISNLENLLGSNYADYLTGNTGANRIDAGLGNDTLSGGLGDDTMNGGTGADSMAGGDGNDVYYYDNAGDQIVETASGGIDEVRTAGSVVLAANMENLTILAIGAADAYGNRLNIITAGSGQINRIDGGAGIDTLSYVTASAGITISLATAGARPPLAAASTTSATLKTCLAATLPTTSAATPAPTIWMAATATTP